MQSSNFSTNNYLQDLLIEYISGKISKKEFKEKLPEDELYHVNEIVLLNFIKCGERIMHVLDDVIQLLSDDSITDNVFNVLTSFPDSKIRDSLIISLSHMDLCYKHLFYLCHEDVTFECYYTLGEKMYNDNEVTKECFQEFMTMFYNSKFHDHIDYFCNNFVIRSDTNVKEDVLNAFSING